MHPPFGPGTRDAVDEAWARADAATGDVAALWRNLAELRALGAAAREELAPLADLLGGGPLVEVPLLDGDVHDLDALAEIRRHLFAAPVAGAVRSEP